ncbi:hypothetical protein [Candidatus Nitronereus thalassa]|uniref:Uncharacterized protein n=1 Tax=Candidatus Nitronereus thalassa TaxID=3020898 RepID=A0ABU3K8P7_9BACT|nr:hypothetical protein [Candidatus Nitronereus thalassa]MDT7042673.1 hypothetical protein [Candidatus Nitronereus thalassa]
MSDVGQPERTTQHWTIAALETKLSEARQLKQGMMQAPLSRKIR